MEDWDQKSCPTTSDAGAGALFYLANLCRRIHPPSRAWEVILLQPDFHAPGHAVLPAATPEFADRCARRVSGNFTVSSASYIRPFDSGRARPPAPAMTTENNVISRSDNQPDTNLLPMWSSAN